MYIFLSRSLQVLEKGKTVGYLLLVLPSRTIVPLFKEVFPLEFRYLRSLEVDSFCR